MILCAKINSDFLNWNARIDIHVSMFIQYMFCETGYNKTALCIKVIFVMEAIFCKGKVSKIDHKGKSFLVV